MSKSLQKEIPDLVEKSGLAKIKVRKKGGTEVTFDEKNFEPYGKKSSNEMSTDRENVIPPSLPL
jgi:hypothetical protein